MKDSAAWEKLTRENHAHHWREICSIHDRTMSLLLLLQWFACIAISVWTAPFSWTESGGSLHEQIWISLIFGGLLSLFPAYLAKRDAGTAINRHVFAVAQVLFSSALIHLLDGRIEAHFHIFCSLALLAFYRDWRVIVSATIVVIVDHALRGLYWPELIYGTSTASILRTLEHGMWVIFLDIFLILSCVRSQIEMLEISRKSSELRMARDDLDARVLNRTLQLERQREEVDRLALVAKNTTNAVMLMDSQGAITWVNAGWERLHGSASLDAIGHQATNWLQLGTDSNGQHFDREMLMQDRGFRAESHLISGGRERVIDTEIQPMWDAKEDLTGFMVIQNDVTEQAILRERLSSVFAAIAEGIVVQNATGAIIEFNPEAERIFEIKHSTSDATHFALSAETIFEDGSLWLPEDHPAMVTLRSGIPIRDAIMGVRGAHGTLRWISVNTQLIRTKGDNGHVVSSFTDITARREQLERLDLTIRGAGLGVWDWNATTENVRWNHLFARMLGYTPEQLKPTRKQWLDLIHPEDLAESQRMLDEHLRGDKTDYRCEYRMQHASGAWHWVLAAGRVVERDQEQQPLRIAGVHIDINKSKKLENKLRESETRLRQIFELALDGVVATDANGLIHDWNRQAEKIFGFSRQEAIGTRLDQLLKIDCETGSNWLANIGVRTSGGGIGERIQAQAISKDDKTLIIELAISPLGTDSNLAYSIFLRDLTQSKMLEQKLVSAQRLESIGQLAAGVAHEINTPVQFVNDSVHFLRDGVQDLFGLIDAVTTAIETLDETPTKSLLVGKMVEARNLNDLEYLTENLPKAIDRSLDGLTRVADIVRSMKEFSHRGSGEMKATDLTRAINNTLTVAQNEYKYIADVETDFAALPAIVCNSGEISQVLLNLIVNAAHAIGDRLVGTNDRGLIRVKTSTDGYSVWVSISDTGGGIPKKIQNRIFEPFFTTKEVGRGSGQGLAIAHSMIQNHHGELTFETTLGVGTTFHIRLPVEQNLPFSEARK